MGVCVCVLFLPRFKVYNVNIFQRFYYTCYITLYYIFIVNKYTGTSMQSDQKFTRPVCHMQPTMHIAQCCTALQLPRNISTNVKLK